MEMKRQRRSAPNNDDKSSSRVQRSPAIVDTSRTIGNKDDERARDGDGFTAVFRALIQLIYNRYLPW